MGFLFEHPPDNIIPCRLYDEKGMGPVSFGHLPRHVGRLQDDFFRSLAYFVKHGGGYGKTETDFSDFQWANFLRANLSSSIPRKNPVFKTDVNAVQPWSFCEVDPYSVACVGPHSVLIESCAFPVVFLTIFIFTDNIYGFYSIASRYRFGTLSLCSWAPRLGPGTGGPC